MYTSRPRPGGVERPPGVDPFLSTLLFMALFVLMWPALIGGAIIWRLVHARPAWLWLIVVMVGMIGALLFWRLDDPINRIQAIMTIFDIHHPTPALHLAFPFWLATMVLSPLTAGVIELVRPKNAKERLLTQVAQAEARRVRRSKRASRMVRRAPDTTSDGAGVLGRVIE